MQRHEVFALIDGEREYQGDRWRHTCALDNVPYTPDETKRVEEWLSFIYGYFQDAMQVASHVAGPLAALDVIRKLAGLCVACMEANGIVWRNQDCTMNPVKRKLVYRAINGERNYQDLLGPDRTDTAIIPDGPGPYQKSPPSLRKTVVTQRTPHGELILFETYLRRAFDAWTDNPGNEPALDVIRKLAAICVRCMEHHGAPARVPFDASVSASADTIGTQIARSIRRELRLNTSQLKGP